MKKVRVLIADDHTLFREGLRQLLEMERDLEVIGEACDGIEAVSKSRDLQPDVVLANSTPATAALQRETRTIPIVFVTISDPVGADFVASVPRPGGNITGFMLQEAGMAGKWLELLTEIAPAVRRPALMFNPETAPYVRSYYLPLFEAAARSLKVAPIVAPVYSDAEIETVIGSIGRETGAASSLCRMVSRPVTAR